MSAAVPDRRAAFAAALFGVMTLAIFIGFRTLEPVRAALASDCGAPETFADFQLARTQHDLIAVFSAPAGVCRAPIVAAMDAANRLDLYAFIPAYAAFLIAASIALAGAWRTKLALAAVAAVVIAAAGDVLETATQLRITPRIEEAEPLLAPMAAGFWIKNGALGVYAALVAAIALTPPRRRFVLAAAGAIAALATVGAAFDAERVPFMMLCYAGFWAVILVMALARLASPQARGASPA